MSFGRLDLGFEPGLFENRSKRASRQRWVDGNLVRFRDGVPAQMGGWRSIATVGATITGRPRGAIAFRLNNQAGRYAAIGTHSNAYLFDGGSIIDITPTDIGTGRVDSILGAGYGSGLYGDDDYGTERATGTTLLTASTWSFDMFGEVLLGCFSTDGKIRQYLNGTDAQLTTIGTAPLARCICVSQERHVFAFGCNGQPNMVMWSDRENRAVWTPTSSNRAGFYEMQTSSPFQHAARVRGAVVAWTQSEVVTFYPLSNSLVYGRETLDENGGAVGPLAVCVATQATGETAYWMGSDGFYLFDGTVRRMPCDLQDYVFNDINQLQSAKFEAATNVEFDEVRFSYCSAGSNEIDRCVVFCTSNGTWTKANVSRLTWLDRKIFPKPIAADATGALFEHEVGTTANGVALDSYVLSHPIILGAADTCAEVSEFWPDLDEYSDGAALTFIGRYYAGGDDVVFGPFDFLPTTEKIDLNIAVRQLQLKISGTGGYWELGLPQISVQGGSFR